MLVPLTADEGSSTPWAMIEMQGELERKDGGSLEEAFDVGTLSVTSSVRGIAGGEPTRDSRQQAAAARAAATGLAACKVCARSLLLSCRAP